MDVMIDNTFMKIKSDNGDSPDSARECYICEDNMKLNSYIRCRDILDVLIVVRINNPNYHLSVYHKEEPDPDSDYAVAIDGNYIDITPYRFGLDIDSIIVF